MLVSTAVLALIGIVALLAAIATHTDALGFLAIGAAVVGLLLILIDGVRGRRGGGPAGDAMSGGQAVRRELFDDPALARDIQREERVTAKDMLGVDVPREEARTDLLASGQRDRRHGDPAPRARSAGRAFSWFHVRRPR